MPVKTIADLKAEAYDLGEIIKEKRNDLIELMKELQTLSAKIKREENSDTGEGK